MGAPPTAVLWATFAYLLAGVNLINPLLPTIRVGLGVGTGGVAALYSLYLAALVPLLLLLPKLRWGATPRSRLLLAVGLTAGSDVLHAAGHPAALGAGRLLLATGVALGTAAVAELAVLTAGERGRTVTATANTAGALLGTVVGGVGLVLATSPVPVVFLSHAMFALLLPVVIVRVVPDASSALLREVDDAGGGGPRRTTGRLDGVILGAFAFAAGSSVIVLGPSLFEQAGEPLGGRALLVPLALFVSAALAQRRVHPSRASILRGCLTALVGMTVLLSSVVAASFPLLVLGAAVTGVGFGVVFMLGLAWTSHDLDSREQGAVASVYACVAYASAAAVTVGGGYLADAAGAAAALLAILLLSSITVVAWVIRARCYPDDFGSPGKGAAG